MDEHRDEHRDGPGDDGGDEAGTPLLPLFPLGTVLVPGLVLPLHVFEPRYRLLVQLLLARPADRREFGVVAIREGREVGPDGIRALYEVGTTALVRTVVPHEDGRYDLVTTGARRFRLLGIDDSRPYLQGRVEFIAEPDEAPPADLVALVRDRFAGYRAAVAGLGAEEAAGMPDLPEDPAVLSYLVAAAVVLDLSDRQRLLALPGASQRLRAEADLLRRETGLLHAVPSLPAVALARTPVDLN